MAILGHEQVVAVGHGLPSTSGLDDHLSPIAEPISPELVLVDPELARRARAQLPDRPIELAPQPSRANRPHSHGDLWIRDPADDRRSGTTRSRYAALIAAGAVIMTAGALTPVALSLIAGTESSETPKALQRLSSTAVAPPPSSTPDPLRPPGSVGEVLGEVRPPARKASPRKEARLRPRRDPRSVARSRVAGRRLASIAERKILALLPTAPRSKVPSTLVDRRLGLVRPNVYVVCRPGARPRRLRCIVRPPRHRAGEGLYVNYRALPGGRARIRWERYRRG